MAHAVFFTAKHDWEVPSSVQLFLVEDDGTRTALDFPRRLPHPDIDDVQVSAELLGVAPGTRVQVEVTCPTGRTLRNGAAEQSVHRVTEVAAGNVGVVSGAAAAAGLGAGAVIQSIHNRTATGRFVRTADGWRCPAAPSGDVHPSWHAIATGQALEYRIVHDGRGTGRG